MTRKRDKRFTTAMNVQAAADSGVDIVNVETGEFYSFSRHMRTHGRVAGIYGRVALSDLEQMRNEITMGTASMDVAAMLEQAALKTDTRLSPRLLKDGHAMSIKEASRISHSKGWVEARPEVVWDEPGLGCPVGSKGDLERKLDHLDEVRTAWADMPFTGKREALAQDLRKFGFNPVEIGNPLTLQQASYIRDLWIERTPTAPYEIAELAYAGALASHEATRVIDSLRKSNDTGKSFELESSSELSGRIKSAHGRYEEAHGQFTPAPERGDDELAAKYSKGDGAHADMLAEGGDEPPTAGDFEFE